MVSSRSSTILHECRADISATSPDLRWIGSASEWVFPGETMSGHIEPPSLKKQHAKALKASGVAPFELCVLRHTCLTQWANWMDPFTVHRVAGHADMKTTMRYVHPSDEDMDRALVKSREAQGGYKFWHTPEVAVLEGTGEVPAIH
jgi:integrase